MSGAAALVALPCLSGCVSIPNFDWNAAPIGPCEISIETVMYEEYVRAPVGAKVVITYNHKEKHTLYFESNDSQGQRMPAHEIGALAGAEGTHNPVRMAYDRAPERTWTCFIYPPVRRHST